MAGLDLATQYPYALAGVAVGVLAFSVLMLVLVPVLRHKRKASLPKGFLGIAVSFAILTLGVVVVRLVDESALLAILLGELLSFFICWIGLAVAVIVGK